MTTTTMIATARKGDDLDDDGKGATGNEDISGDDGGATSDNIDEDICEGVTNEDENNSNGNDCDGRQQQ
jgi:hypothetical protein